MNNFKLIETLRPLLVFFVLFTTISCTKNQESVGRKQKSLRSTFITSNGESETEEELPVPESDCYDFSFENKNYIYCGKVFPLNHANALRTCAGLGMELANFRTKEEYEGVIDSFKEETSLDSVRRHFYEVKEPSLELTFSRATCQL